MASLSRARLDHVVFGIAAGVVFAVRQHDEHALLVGGPLQVFQARDDGVVQRRLAAGAVRGQRGVQQRSWLVKGTVGGRPYLTFSLK